MLKQIVSNLIFGFRHLHNVEVWECAGNPRIITPVMVLVTALAS